MEKIKLTVQERSHLFNLLPKSGDYLTYKILHDIKSQIFFSEVEVEKYGIKFEQQTDNKVLILWEINAEKEIEIGDKGKEIIKKALQKLNDESLINDRNVSLYEKFMDKDNHEKKE